MSEQVLLFCHHCHKPYLGDPRSRYCSGTHKSQAYRERKESMIDLLVKIVHSVEEGKYSHFTRVHADRVVESFHTNVKALINAWGFQYDDFMHVWVKV